MGMMPEQITKTVGETLKWACNHVVKDGGVPALAQIEIDAESKEITALVIPGDQRVVITIEVREP